MLVETLSVRETREQLPGEMTAERTRSFMQAAASVRAEGLTASAHVETVMERWTGGEISTEQMRNLVRRLYGAA
ncbi:antitoxin VbhA family protein [Solwaraspora sp. WMMA2080]|uniref:antitoxin VbhA family protein n=1 Tax=unclassified Solwaraspora TaxID=2627926 RepID=UPI00248B191D|nr:MULTISPECIES: antitoxin VbhA family protein [unclassified Solwaraspora]WBB95529.1 antitoxin VbhA family protein [Solwaraspora sp. WMMA2059]WBC20566.1 antitoxin VbhA family protein [Solwaraspora sp. WMMA2080]